MKGNILESLFDYSYQQQWNLQYFLVRQSDLPTKYKPKQMVDRLLLSWNKNYAFEMKHTEGNSLPLSRIPNHQLEFLRIFQHQCGYGYFILSFNGLQDIYLVNIELFDKIVGKSDKKSINASDLAGYIGIYVAYVNSDPASYPPPTYLQKLSTMILPRHTKPILTIPFLEKT